MSALNTNNRANVVDGLNEKYDLELAHLREIKQRQRQEWLAAQKPFNETRAALVAYGASRPGLRRGKKANGDVVPTSDVEV
jgi:hypothetical protein